MTNVSVSSRLIPRPYGYRHTASCAKTGASSSTSSGRNRRSSSRSVVTSPSGAAIGGAREDMDPRDSVDAGGLQQIDHHHHREGDQTGERRDRYEDPQARGLQP